MSRVEDLKIDIVTAKEHVKFYKNAVDEKEKELAALLSKFKVGDTVYAIDSKYIITEVFWNFNQPGWNGCKIKKDGTPSKVVVSLCYRNIKLEDG